MYEDEQLLNELLALPYPSGEGAYADPASKKMRFETILVVVENGRPVKVAEEFRKLIERDGTQGRLTDPSHMAKLIPMVGKVYDSRLKKKKIVSLGIIFDGLSDKGSWVPVVARASLEGREMIVEQFLLDMPHTSSPYNHAILNQIILKAISKLDDEDIVDYGNADENKPKRLNELVRFFMHDDAEVNNKSGAYLREGMFLLSNEFSCGCHCLYRVGENVATELVDEFDDLFIGIFKNADKRRHLLRLLVGLSIPSRNKIKVTISAIIMPYYQLLISDLFL